MATTLSPKKNAVERFGELLLETEQHSGQPTGCARGTAEARTGSASRPAPQPGLPRDAQVCNACRTFSVSDSSFGSSRSRGGRRRVVRLVMAA